MRGAQKLLRLLARAPVAAFTRPASTAAVPAPAGANFTKWTDPVPRMHNYTPMLATVPTQVTTLPNGLRIASETMPYAETATVGVWIDAGSRYETKETNGTAHFLEHMAFKGTKSRTMAQLEEEVENMGGHLNAYTSREQTTYYAKVLKSDVAKAVDILSDILQNSLLDPKAVEAERAVILREMEEVEGDSNEVLFDHLHATAFQHSPLGRTILGSAANVRSLSKQALADYVAAHYTAPRMVISAAGAVDHKALVEAATKAFGKLPTAPGATAAALCAAAPAVFTGSDVRIRDDDVPTCTFAVAFEGAAWSDPDAVTLMVMQTMLGSWHETAAAEVHMGSPLAQRVAASGLAKSFTAFCTHYNDTGLFGVTATAAGGEGLEDLAFAVMYELAKLSYHVADDDVARARNQLKSGLMLHLDGTSAVAEDIGRQLLTYGRRLPPAELFARIDAVDAAAVKRAAGRFIRDKELAIAAMGATGDLPDYNWFRRHTWWLRY